jgi:hypothetical protein
MNGPRKNEKRGTCISHDTRRVPVLGVASIAAKHFRPRAMRDCGQRPQVHLLLASALVVFTLFAPWSMGAI